MTRVLHQERVKDKTMSNRVTISVQNKCYESGVHEEVNQFKEYHIALERKICSKLNRIRTTVMYDALSTIKLQA